MKLAINQATLMKTPMEEFLQSIAKAGFEGVELRRDETFEYLKSNTVEDLKQLLDANNLKCITFNAIELFSLCPEKEFKGMLEYTERLMKIGNEIDCDTIITVPSFVEGSHLSESKIASQTIARLKILAQVAEQYSFKLGFEPLGFPNCSVRKVDLALKIIKSEGLPKMGLIIDTFHYFVGEHSIDDLDSISLDDLWLIHVNDSVQKPLEQLKDSDRVIPGKGFFKLDSFFDKLKSKGYDKWLSIELFNEQLWTENPYKVAQETLDSLRKIALLPKKD